MKASSSPRVTFLETVIAIIDPLSTIFLSRIIQYKVLLFRTKKITISLKLVICPNLFLKNLLRIMRSRYSPMVIDTLPSNISKYSKSTLIFLKRPKMMPGMKTQMNLINIKWPKEA